MRKQFLLLFILLHGMVAIAQSEGNSDRIHIGVKGGIHGSFTKYSDLKNRDPKTVLGGVGGVFAEFELGEKRIFSLRPEVLFLRRGTKISDDEIDYKLKAKYVDIRLPFIWNIGEASGVRPYLYVAPIAGFVRGGNITLSDMNGDYKVDVSKANMASTYFAGALGAGIKIPLQVANGKFIRIDVDANYQYGFTDTYGSKEKDGIAIAVNTPVYNLKGTRKMHGMEITASVSVPLSIFKKAPKKKVAQPIVITPEPIPEPEPEAEPVKEEVKPCYSLEEILDLAAAGKTIVGKTICAIDMINFEFDKSVIKKESYPYIDKIAELMKNTDVHIKIKGHTDNVGNADYNMKLSKKRAEAVYQYLFDKGVNKSRLSYEYFGMTKPIAPNATEEGRLANRRVEFEIVQ